MIPISLKDKSALIGGSTQGLGKAIAMQMARSGATITLMSRNEKKLAATLQNLPAEYDQKHQYLVVDFNNHHQFKTQIETFFENNSIDILVNNTQGPASGTALEKETSDYQQAFELLFQNVVFTTMKALPYMQQNNFGRIINVSSISVKEPLSNLVLSNSIRSALIAWAKTLSKEVAKDNITVNNILTGFFDTERLNKLFTQQAEKNAIPVDEWKKNKISGVPAGRLGEPDEYGYLAAFLASDLAAYITGTNIPIDGGLGKSTS